MSAELKSKVLEQISLWTGMLSFIGMIVVGFVYVTGPSQDNDTAIQLQAQRISAQDETIKSLTKTQQNDTQEVKSNLTALTNQVNSQNISIEKLSTIIDERIPKRN